MRVRPLDPSDAEPWYALRLLALRERPTAFLISYAEELADGVEAVRKRISQPREHFVIFGAYAESTLVGTVGCARGSRASVRHRCTLWGVYVRPDSRGQGVARALLEHAIAFAKEQMAAEVVELGVNVENTGARALYESLGFDVYGIQHDAFRVDGEACHEALLALHLSSKGHRP